MNWTLIKIVVVLLIVVAIYWIFSITMTLLKYPFEETFSYSFREKHHNITNILFYFICIIGMLPLTATLLFITFPLLYVLFNM